MLRSSFAANVATELMGELGHFRRAVTEILAVPDDLVLPQSSSPTPTSGERLVKRVIRVDKLLRQLVSGPQDRVAIEADFTGRKAVLERLLSFHILFLDGSPKAGTIAYESNAVRDIASNILSSTAHAQRMELARTLLEWQEAASNAKAVAEEPHPIWGWLGVGEWANEAAATRTRVKKLEASIKKLREQVAGGAPALGPGGLPMPAAAEVVGSLPVPAAGPVAPLSAGAAA